MRIISGSHRGRQLHPPAGLPVRPTTDLAKESLFNILWNYFDFKDLRVLDLFAGTGNISLEFAARGAEVLAVEIHPACVDFIRKTARELDFQRLSVLRGEVFHFLARPGQAYDIIFADPPYDRVDDTLRLPGLILPSGRLTPGGWLIVEHPPRTDMSGEPGFFDLRHYGKVHFSFFRQEVPV